MPDNDGVAEDRVAENRAEKLADGVRKTAGDHEGNRASADDDAPQPTREPTRDQRE